MAALLKERKKLENYLIDAGKDRGNDQMTRLLRRFYDRVVTEGGDENVIVEEGPELPERNLA